MTTTTATDDATDFAVTAHELTLGERVAADLATLGALATSRPELADLIATTVSQLYIVLGRSTPISLDDVIADAVEAGAVETDLRPTDPYFSTRAVDFPSGAIRLAVTWLQPSEPTEPTSDVPLFAVLPSTGL